MPRMSEARLNDLTYMALRHLFFVPMFGEGAVPRECDIRICMDMACPEERATSLQQAILWPNEVSGRSHEISYEVDTDRVLEEVIGYMEDHWLKQTMAEAYKDPDARAKAERFYREEIVRVVMETPEEKCGG